MQLHQQQHLSLSGARSSRQRGIMCCPRRQAAAAAVPLQPRGGRPCVATAAAAAESAGAAVPSAQILQPEADKPLKAEQTAQFLRQELGRLFTQGGDLTESAYASDVAFEDPITRLQGLTPYSLMIRALKTLTAVTFDVHDVSVTAPDTVTSRWTMGLRVWQFPWQPTVLISGRSFYTIDVTSGLIKRHVDTWDAVGDSSFFSPEAVGELLRQVSDLSLTPSLEGPRYKVLRVKRQYEVRQYEDFVVAEAPMGAGSSPAGGAGFNELAGYIFGGNSEGAKMEMTTPVFSKPGANSAAPSTMEFVMERSAGSVEQLPAPNNPRVTAREVPGGFVAVLRFGGLPLPFEVTRAERQLREALLADGLTPKAGYKLARYNEPFVLPPFKRNEVLIDLQDFSWT